MTRSRINACLLVLWLIMPACSTVVGADFDGLVPVGAAGDTGASGTSGAVGSAVGGSSSAGVSGSASDAGGANVGGEGGRSGAGGMTVAGNAGASGSGSGAGGGPTETGGSGGHGDAGNGGTSGVSGADGHGGAGSGGTSGVGGSGGYVSPTGLVLNELKGQGPGSDYIELYNRTAEPLDIAACSVSDDSNNRVTFPPGATIAPTSYVLVRLQQTTSTGMVTSCLGYTPCYDGISWGISASGETILLRDAKGMLLDQLTYPDQNGASGLVDGQALGRVPDGGTTVGAILVSPGASNNAAE